MSIIPSTGFFQLLPGCCRFSNIPVAGTSPGLGGNGYYFEGSGFTMTSCQDQCSSNSYCVAGDFTFSSANCYLWFGNPTDLNTGCAGLATCFVKGIASFVYFLSEASVFFPNVHNATFLKPKHSLAIYLNFNKEM